MRNVKIKKANPEALSRRGIFKYNTTLKDRVREMRKNPTPAELKIWNELLSNRPQNYKFLRQKPIGNYILDFYCSELLLGIEIDGDIHQQNQEYDNQRNDYLTACGIKIARFKNDEVLNSFKKIKSEILKIIFILNKYSPENI